MVRQRTEIGQLPAYRQGASTPGAVKLSSNENPYPPLRSVIDAVAAELGDISIYPPMAAAELVGRLAERFDVTGDEIAVGAGSVEVAAQLIHSAAGAGDEVIFAWRSFEAYPSLVRIAGATPVPVALTDDDRHDLDAMAAAVTPHTRLIFVCNPNNPTGAVVTGPELHAFMAKIPADVLVVVDEAYVHFDVDPDSADGLEFYRTYPNVAVLHTFSKAYGLAGLRIGYAIARPEIVENLRRVAVPFAVTALAQRAAVASLDAETELDERVQHINAERARVTTALRELGWNVLSSQGNFIWLRTGDDTTQVDAVLREHGVLARAYAADGIRVTIGDPTANDLVLTAAAEALAPVA